MAWPIIDHDDNNTVPRPLSVALAVFALHQQSPQCTSCSYDTASVVDDDQYEEYDDSDITRTRSSRRFQQQQQQQQQQHVRS